MSAVMKLPLERRQYNQHLVTELQQARYQVWNLYSQIAKQKPFSCSSSTQALLTHFSQLLIDYVSLGHFGIYERLISGAERREIFSATAKKLYPTFSKTTEIVLNFNDQYDDHKPILNIDTLETDLSTLGENLAQRMELEDNLCHLILN